MRSGIASMTGFLIKVYCLTVYTDNPSHSLCIRVVHLFAPSTPLTSVRTASSLQYDITHTAPARLCSVTGGCVALHGRLSM